MIKVSIIVPVYNTSKYLDKCLTSLVNQTLKDIEIIVIDDGSSDNSSKIIEEYAKNYKSVKPFYNDNQGVSRTRNFGLSKAKGEYIGFVDSDDFVDITMYEKLYQKANTENFDVVLGNAELFYEDTSIIQILNMPIKKDILEKNEIKKSMTYFYPSLCDKIIKRKIIFNEDTEDYLKFVDDVWYEDMQWMLKIYSNINKIGVVNEVFYHYLQRKHSITHTYSDKLYDIVNNMDGVIDYYKHKKIYEDYYEELEYLYARYSFATFMKRLSKSKNRKIFISGYKYAKQKVIDKFPNYRSNKYMRSNGLKGYYIRNFNLFLANITYFIEKNKDN